jgi:ribosomal protein S18 acetylase RimI-like enzyme
MEHETLPLDEVEIKHGLASLTATKILTLYRRAPLLRPIREPEEIWSMYESSSLVLSAWHRGRLVGIVRGMSDGVLFSYLCDLAVEPDVQGLGIGKKLMDAALSAFKGTDVILRDSSSSAGYYPRIGFQKVTNAWGKRA